MEKKSILKSIKPVFSGHGTFPLRYGWLKKVFDACIDIEISKGNISKDLFNNEESISILGVGKNMVSSMRHWALYTDLLEIDDKKNLSITQNSKKIFDTNGLDPWLENYATLWLIHWKLTTNPKLFTYYYFFNNYNTNIFDKDILTSSINEELKELDFDVSPSTLKRDIECFLNMYASKPSKEYSNEETIESPLTELGLIEHLSRRDLYQLKKGAKYTLSVETFIFALLMFWKEYSPNSSTLSLEAICYEEKSPGRIFMIDENTIGEYIQNLSSKTDGLLEWSETSGLKQIIINKQINFEVEAVKYFERNYI